MAIGGKNFVGRKFLTWRRSGERSGGWILFEVFSFSFSFFLSFLFSFLYFPRVVCCGYVGNGNGVTLFFTSLRTIPNAGTSSKLRIGTELPFVSPLLVHRHAATINPLDVWNKRKRRILEASLAVKLLSSRFESLLVRIGVM